MLSLFAVWDNYAHMQEDKIKYCREVLPKVLEKLESGEKLVGAKQTHKAVKSGKTGVVFLAEDADKKVTKPIELLCMETGVETIFVPTMKELGKLCGISVGAAVAAILK